MGDLFLTAPGEGLAKDALDDRRFAFVDARYCETSARVVALSLELVAEARATGDPALTDATSQRFARSRADGFELHLMPGALDEGRRLIDGVRELNFLTRAVIEEPATPIANQVADDERHLDRIASETGLVATNDHVSTLRIGDQLSKSRAAEEIIT